jgi:hypothetical protein
MRARLGSVALLLLLTVLAACSDEDPESERPGENSTGDVLTDPITFAGEGRSCMSQPGMYLYYAPISTDEALTLTGVELLEPNNTRITGSWLAEVPEDTVDREGFVLGDEPVANDVADTGWEQRAPLASSTLEPGTGYEFFLEMELPRQGGFEAIDFAWTGESGQGTSRLRETVDVKEACA